MIEVKDLVKRFDGFAALDGARFRFRQAVYTAWWGPTVRASPR